MTDYPKADVALLAPVPERHLIEGCKTCKATGYVVFGSDAATVLAELATLVDPAQQADILFYASHAEVGGPPRATYRGRFAGYAGAEKIGAKGDWRQHRPTSTEADTAWLGCYRVGDLREIEPAIPIATLKKRGGAAKFAKAFIPIGPILIDTPF